MVKTPLLNKGIWWVIAYEETGLPSMLVRLQVELRRKR
jgi:hypothetical protein